MQKSAKPCAEKVGGCARGAAALVLSAEGLRLLYLPRLTYRYVPKPLTDRQEQFYQRIIAFSWHHPRYGYRRIRALLAREGWTVSRKQVQRICRREGLKVRTKPKKIPRRGVSTGLPTQTTHHHHVWTWDFIFDQTDNGDTLKMMTLLDEYSRQSLAIQVEWQITAAQVLGVLEQAMIQYGVPGYIRSDNGPEFIAAKVQRWLGDHRIKAIYIDPGSPWQNGYSESFHSRFRDECLSREMLLNLREARVVITDWRQHYNRERPHSRIGYLSPEGFIQTKILVSHTLTGPTIRSRSPHAKRFQQLYLWLANSVGGCRY